MAGSLRRFGVVLAGLVVVSALLVTVGGTAGAAKLVKPKIADFVASPASVTTSDGTVTLSATVANATTCTLSSSLGITALPVPTNCSGGTVSQTVIVPLNSGRKAIKATFTLHATGEVVKSKKLKLTVAAGAGRPPLSGVTNVVGPANIGGSATCAVLSAGSGVDCWGDNSSGALGDGTSTGDSICNPVACSTTPVTVLGVGGTGTLSGVASVVEGGYDSSFCALLTSGEVACWGDDVFGELGAGTTDSPEQCESGPCSTSPVLVGGSDPVTGATALVSDGNFSYCAVIGSTGVDCWGNDEDGDLGAGNPEEPGGPTLDSCGSSGIWCAASPLPVGGGGGGALADVESVSSNNDGSGYCAVLTTTGVDCWGNNNQGQIGDGTASGPDTCQGGSCAADPTPVPDVGGSGSLTGVQSVVGIGEGFCALLTSTEVDCWGDDYNDELGVGGLCDNVLATCPSTPVQVLGVGGVGVLTDVAAIISGVAEGGLSVCVLLTSGGVDCWGNNQTGQSGSGSPDDFSSVPVAVVGVGGSGQLTGATALASTGDGFCSIVGSGGVDCWGGDGSGELGNGDFRESTVPVPVLGTSDADLTGVQGIFENGLGYCALLTSGQVDCWGEDQNGNLGDGSSASPSDVAESVFSTA